MLSDHTLPASFKLERVELREGPFKSDCVGSDAGLYFPIDALLSVGSACTAKQGLSLIGHHACVESQALSGANLHAFVQVPGQAYRVDWPPAQDNPVFYADCLWHAASVAQALIRQMAQWAFCVHHHTREQSLSSWLLHCLTQHPEDTLSLHLAAIPQCLRPEVEPSQTHASEIQALSGYALAQGRLHISSRQLLAQRACSCHQKMAMNQSADA